MNKELKLMIYWAMGLVVLSLIGINFYNFYFNKRLLDVTYRSERVCLNRLRCPKINHSSEIGRYPHIYRHLQLIALQRQDKLYVLHGNQVVYIMNAKIKSARTKTQLNATHGEHTFYIKNNVVTVGNSWTSYGKDGYIESPEVLRSLRRPKWFYQQNQVTNTIRVSQPDAEWLQRLPKGTSLVIK